MCDWRKLPRRVTSRPEIEISDKRWAFSSQTSSIEPSYKTCPKQVKMSISPIAQGFLKIFRVQHVALTARRPKHPCLVWCNAIFLYETFSRLIPRDPNLAHHRHAACGMVCHTHIPQHAVSLREKEKFCTFDSSWFIQNPKLDLDGFRTHGQP